MFTLIIITWIPYVYKYECNYVLVFVLARVSKHYDLCFLHAFVLRVIDFID